MNSAFDIISRWVWNMFSVLCGWSSYRGCFSSRQSLLISCWDEGLALAFSGCFGKHIFFWLRLFALNCPSVTITAAVGSAWARCCHSVLVCCYQLCFHCTSVCRGKCALTFPWWQWWEPRVKRSIESNFSFTELLDERLQPCLLLFSGRFLSININTSHHWDFSHNMWINTFSLAAQWHCVCFWKNSDGKGDSKGKKTPNKPLKILDEDDEDLSALKDPSEKVSSDANTTVKMTVFYCKG